MENIRPVWAEIDLDAIQNNIIEIRKWTRAKEIIGVVKADAYGHGAVDISRILLKNGASKLAVAVITEALELIHSGITAPIMILGYTPTAFFQKIIKYNIEQTVYNYEYAKELSKLAVNGEKIINIHIAIDTGMGRIGFLPTDESFSEIIKINNLPNINIKGIFTHFSSADEQDKTYTNEQYMRFTEFIKKLEQKDINIEEKHVCNSAAILDLKEFHLDAIRPGIILYGYYPSKEIKNNLNLKKALTLKTSVVHVKKLQEDMYISYGRKYKTQKVQVIATIPIGYADGYTRALFEKAKVIINGKLAPVIGRICMDQCMVDVTDVGHVSVGDEVILLGEKNGVKFDADDIANAIGTINYEVLCMISKRVPRVYIKGRKNVKIRNYM